MTNIGKELKEARLKKGFTIDDLQQKTKIQKKYLEALELDEYEAMPSTYYVRTFLRQYADAVGLDGNLVVKKFDGQKVQIEQPKIEKITESRKNLHKEEKNIVQVLLDRLPMIVLSLIAVAIITTIGYATWKQHKDSSMIQTSSSVEVDRESTQATTSKTKESSATQTTTSTTQEVKPEIAITSDDGKNIAMSAKNITSPAKLTFSGTNGSCWVGITVGGASVYNYTVKQGETTEYALPEGTAEVKIVLGAAVNLSAKLNDQNLDIIGQTKAYQKNIDLTVTYK